jgi:hypothetical protein
MNRFETSTTIDAPADRVWAIRVKIRSELDPKRAYPVKLTALERPRRMEWRGGMPLGLFTGVRRNTLAAEGEGRTRLDMREEFTGPLLPLIWRTIPDMNDSFRQFASGLKARAEAG